MSVKTIAPATSRSSTSLMEYFRCAEIPGFGLTATPGKTNGFFRFGPDTVCFGQSSGPTHSKVNDSLYDASQHVENNGHGLLLKGSFF